jgi:glycosyltransferase involved in cell wall biosynthesis
MTLKRIGLDLSAWHPEGRGWQRVLKELVPELLALGKARFTAFRGDWPFPLDGLEQIPVSGPFWRHRLLPKLAREQELDLMFFPTTTCWWQGPCPSAVLIQDLAPLECPRQPLLSGTGAWKARLAYRAIRNSHRLFAGSATTAQAIREHWRRDCVTAENGFRPLPRAEALELPESFFLMIGPLDKRRNPENQIEAFFDLVPEPTCLVVTAARDRGDWMLPPERQEALARKNRLLLLDRISDGQLRSLYEKARGLLYASYYEGFGFPVLEARSCGCPVLTGNKGHSDKLWSRGVVSCRADDPASLRRGLRELLTLERSPAEEKTILARYNWRNTAEIIMKHLT